MKKTSSIYKLLILVILVAIAGYFIFQELKQKNHISKPLFIAHASGGINGLTYLNSLETLNYNYQLGHRYFEVDFSWTQDDELVLIHDWKLSYNRLFGNNTQIAPTEEQFLNMKMNFDQTQLSLKQFAQWLLNHPGAILVADIKKHNLKGLKKMLETIEKPFKRIIPQVYHPRNYQKIKDLGFDNILFAMYNTRRPTEELLDFIKNKKLFAISIKPKRKNFDAILNDIGNTDTFVYALIVNNPDEFSRLQSQGVDGTVTDFLYQKNNKILTQK